MITTYTENLTDPGGPGLKGIGGWQACFQAMFIVGTATAVYGPVFSTTAMLNACALVLGGYTAAYRYQDPWEA